MLQKILSVLFAAFMILQISQGTQAATPQKLILWDGEKYATGVGWVSPVAKTMSVEVQHKSAASKTPAVAFHLAQPNTFVECGWQWFPWFPPPTGTDARPYNTLEFAIRVAGRRLPTDISVSLASPGDHHCTGRVSLKRYAANFMDGKWHTLRIPLTVLYTADRKDLAARFPDSFYDASHTIQLILGTWNADGDYTVFLDNLALTHQNMIN